MKDRNDYRSMSTADLIQEVHYGIRVDWQELAVALSERLELTAHRDHWGLIDDDY